MQKATTWLRAVYSVSGAVLFNFGAVLLWATLKEVLPPSNPLRTLFGLGSGVALLTVAHRYLKFVDGSDDNSGDDPASAAQ
jgi:hypothetical protein